jgi:hypothetical protein
MKKTIQHYLKMALETRKTINSEHERERATIYMKGLAQMRKDALVKEPWSSIPFRWNKAFLH